MAFIRKISASTLDDGSLIEKYKISGDTAIVAELFDRYIEMVYAVCIKYLRDQETAKDAVMDVFGQLTLKLSNHAVLNFKSWLYTLVKNHCLMKLRSTTRERTVNLDDHIMQFPVEMHQEDGKETEFQVQRLSGCIEKLSADQKIVISLFYLKEHSYKEISQMSGMEWNKVRSLVQNGRRNLKICMEENKESEEPVLKTVLNNITKTGEEKE